MHAQVSLAIWMTVSCCYSVGLENTDMRIMLWTKKASYRASARGHDLHAEDTGRLRAG